MELASGQTRRLSCNREHVIILSTDTVYIRQQTFWHPPFRLCNDQLLSAETAWHQGNCAAHLQKFDMYHCSTALGVGGGGICVSKGGKRRRTFLSNCSEQIAAAKAKVTSGCPAACCFSPSVLINAPFGTHAATVWKTVPRTSAAASAEHLPAGASKLS